MATSAFASNLPERRQEKGQSVYVLIAESLVKTDGSAESARKMLLEAFGPAALEAAEILFEYAQSDDEHQMAPEAEMEAVAVARKLVRPLLEARLQRRVDTSDQATKKKPCARSAKTSRSRRAGGGGGGGAWSAC